MNKEHNHCHNEDCNCDHHDDHETLTLTLDNNEDLECYVLGIFEVDELEYIALLPKEEENVYIYKYSELDNDEVKLDNIEDDEEFEKVSKTFEQLIESSEDDTDQDED